VNNAPPLSPADLTSRVVRLRDNQFMTSSTPPPRQIRSEYRRLWWERLERLWQQACRDAFDRQSGAMTAAVRVAETAIRLDGLAAPSEVMVHNPSEAEIEAWVMALLEERQPQVKEADAIDAAD